MSTNGFRYKWKEGKKYLHGPCTDRLILCKGSQGTQSTQGYWFKVCQFTITLALREEGQVWVGPKGVDQEVQDRVSQTDTKLEVGSTYWKKKDFSWYKNTVPSRSFLE